MALIPLTDKGEIAATYRQMASRLEEGAKRFTRKIGFHGGYVEHRVYWNKQHRFWFLFDRSHIGTRYWCCYGTADPTDQSMLSITVETNSPYKGVNRRIGGVFVRDEAGRVYIAHSGKIGGGRPGIGKEAFWEFYGGEDDIKTVEWPDGQTSEVIVIGRVDGEHFVTHIAQFVHRVEEFKAITAGEKPAVPRQRLRQLFTPEFAGMRRGYTPSGEIEARCDHGTVVNRLYKLLEAAGHKAVNDRRDLYIRAGQKVTHLFEVKTDLSTTSFYQGVGQLMLHGAALRPTPKLILVVPGKPSAATGQALDRLGIAVLAFDWKDGQPAFGRLNDLLR